MQNGLLGSLGIAVVNSQILGCKRATPAYNPKSWGLFTANPNEPLIGIPQIQGKFYGKSLNYFSSHYVYNKT